MAPVHCTLAYVHTHRGWHCIHNPCRAPFLTSKVRLTHELTWQASRHLAAGSVCVFGCLLQCATNMPVGNEANIASKDPDVLWQNFSLPSCHGRICSCNQFIHGQAAQNNYSNGSRSQCLKSVQSAPFTHVRYLLDSASTPLNLPIAIKPCPERRTPDHHPGHAARICISQSAHSVLAPSFRAREKLDMK